MFGQKKCDEVCENVYSETRKLYEENRSVLAEHDCGFKIMNGPCRWKPPILFLSYQPGGDAEDGQEFQRGGAHNTPAPHLEFLESPPPYLLWRRFREIVLQDDVFLSECVGMNAIFFRSPSISVWNKVEIDLRSKLTQHCIESTKKLIFAMQPKLVVVNGSATSSLFNLDIGHVEHIGKATLKESTIYGFPALITWHLSGSRTSNEYREGIGQRIRTAAGFPTE